jgi:hypothetical protein
MKLDIARVDVWAATIIDKPGSLSQKLEILAQADINLEFVIARRSADKPGTGVVFATPITGAKQIRAARKVGFEKTKSLHSIRVAATDKPGLVALITKQIANVGINLRGLSAAAIGKRAVFHLAFDSADDANKASRQLKKASS